MLWSLFSPSFEVFGVTAIIKIGVALVKCDGYICTEKHPDLLVYDLILLLPLILPMVGVGYFLFVVGIAAFMLR